jgi:HEAT repeat protein
VSSKQSAGQGKSLNAWLDELVATRGTSTQAIAAFRAAGPNAIPFLTNVLTRASPLRDKAVRLKSNLKSGTLFKILPTWYYQGWPQRQYAALALGEIGPTASNSVPALINAINQTEIFETDRSKNQGNGTQFSPYARAEAIRALGKINPSSPQVLSASVAALTQRAPAGTSHLRSAAADVLSGIGPESKEFIPKLIANLKYWDKSHYRGNSIAAVYSVGALAPGYGESVPQLIQVLEGSDPQGRTAAAYDLGTLEHNTTAAKAALPALLNALNDPVPEVRLGAAEAITNINPTEKTVPALIELLRATDWTVRIRAVEELRRLGPSARDALRGLQERRNDEARAVRVWPDEAIKTIQATSH